MGCRSGLGVPDNVPRPGCEFGKRSPSAHQPHMCGTGENNHNLNDFCAFRDADIRRVWFAVELVMLGGEEGWNGL